MGWEFGASWLSGSGLEPLEPLSSGRLTGAGRLLARLIHMVGNLVSAAGLSSSVHGHLSTGLLAYPHGMAAGSPLSGQDRACSAFMT